MSLDNYLLRDERILASAKSSSNATLYATNKRVIRYEKGYFNEKVDSLSYSHIVAASLESESYFWVAILGILFVIIGVYFGSQLGILLAVLGIVSILIGVFYRPAWYQLKAPGLTSSELKRWRTATAKEDAKTFARFIQDQISARETPVITTEVVMPPITKEKEVIIKEVVMVNCGYCGGLMPQTSMFCPNCGAKRK
jgi:hypothetical protein